MQGFHHQPGGVVGVFEGETFVGAARGEELLHVNQRVGGARQGEGVCVQLGLYTRQYGQVMLFAVGHAIGHDSYLASKQRWCLLTRGIGEGEGTHAVGHDLEGLAAGIDDMIVFGVDELHHASALKGFIGGIAHTGGQGSFVTATQITGHIGLHHQVLMGGGRGFHNGVVHVTGMGGTKELPCGDALGQGEGDAHLSIAVGAQGGIEEGGLRQVLTQSDVQGDTRRGDLLPLVSGDDDDSTCSPCSVDTGGVTATESGHFNDGIGGDAADVINNLSVNDIQGLADVGTCVAFYDGYCELHTRYASRQIALLLSAIAHHDHFFQCIGIFFHYNIYGVRDYMQGLRLVADIGKGETTAGRSHQLIVAVDVGHRAYAGAYYHDGGSDEGLAIGIDHLTANRNSLPKIADTEIQPTHDKFFFLGMFNMDIVVRGIQLL